MNRVSIIIFRVMMSALILFEILNGLGILQFSLVYTWQGLVVVALFGWIAAEFIIARKKNVNVPLLLALIFIAVFLDASGDFFRFYALFEHYDKFLHFFNSGVVTYIVFIAFRERMQKANLTRNFSAFIVISTTSFLGTLYEIEEFLEDMFINKKQLRLGDGVDTAGDLLSNVIGCVLMTVILFMFVWKKNKER